MNKVYCCFPGGKHKALTMSYDDGKQQDRRLVDIFNQNGIKGTFHLNSGFLGDDRHIQPDEVRTLYAGHEVACHTVTHPTITRPQAERLLAVSQATAARLLARMTSEGSLQRLGQGRDTYYQLPR